MSSLHITLIQSNIYWENKEANLNSWQQKIDALPQGAEVVVLPEMFSTGFSMQTKQLAETMDGPTVEWMRTMAKHKNIVLAGSVIIEENNVYYNRLIWMLPNGAYSYYDKHHLFTYSKEDKYFTPGQKRLIVSVKGWKILLLICYDLRFPVWSSQQVQQTATSTQAEFDAIIYVASWPERRNAAWKSLLQARAIENQCYVIGVNRVGEDGNNIYHSGDSMVVDPLGTILYHKENEEDIAAVILDREHIDKIRRCFPFWKDADAFIRKG